MLRFFLGGFHGNKGLYYNQRVEKADLVFLFSDFFFSPSGRRTHVEHSRSSCPPTQNTCTFFQDRSLLKWYASIDWLYSIASMIMRIYGSKHKKNRQTSATLTCKAQSEYAEQRNPELQNRKRIRRPAQPWVTKHNKNTQTSATLNCKTQ